MATAFSSLLTSFGYRLNDTGSPAQFDSTQRKAWFNRGKDLVFREVPYKLTNGNLVGVDGSAYSFDLADSATQTNLLRFHRIKGISIPSSSGSTIVRDPKGIDAFRQIQVSGGPYAGIPYLYYVQGTTVFFNYIPANGAVITIDFWQTPADLSADADTLLELASTGWDDMFLEAAKLCAGRDLIGINQEFGDRLVSQAKAELYGEDGFFDKFRQFVKAELGEDAEDTGIANDEFGSSWAIGVAIPSTNPVLLGDDYR